MQPAPVAQEFTSDALKEAATSLCEVAAAVWSKQTLEKGKPTTQPNTLVAVRFERTWDVRHSGMLWPSSSKVANASATSSDNVNHWLISACPSNLDKIDLAHATLGFWTLMTSPRSQQRFGQQVMRKTESIKLITAIFPATLLLGCLVDLAWRNGSKSVCSSLEKESTDFKTGCRVSAAF